MPGEHFCTTCERNLRKLKDPFVKVRWRNWLKPKTAEVVAIICPDCQGKNEDLSQQLMVLRKYGRSPPMVKVGIPCSICDSKIKGSERNIRVEWYNIEKPEEEIHAAACNKCITRKDLGGMRILSQNPNFKLSITCLSSHICGSLKEPKRDRGINCQNIVVNMDGNLYCRRAHPGHVRIYREKWAFPPSVRALRNFFKDYWKNMKPFMAYMEGRYKFGSVADARRKGEAERELADSLPSLIIPLAEEEKNQDNEREVS